MIDGVGAEGGVVIVLEAEGELIVVDTGGGLIADLSSESLECVESKAIEHCWSSVSLDESLSEQLLVKVLSRREQREQQACYNKE